LIRVVSLSLERKNINLRKTISMETRLTMALAKLGSENSLQMCGEVYGNAKSKTSIIIKEFCVAI
jgi:hypothetical protein